MNKRDFQILSLKEQKDTYRRWYHHALPCDREQIAKKKKEVELALDKLLRKGL